ncbi:MAG TPA: TrmH family RNA methyltransferase [Planctomycetia bacterium]|nr:TrmH family RNA methyltransferase [Planctomycetia bacterium]
MRPPPRMLLLLGNEGDGLPVGVRDACDAAVSIPLSAAVDSLNVAVAAGILLHALAHRP